MNIIIRNQTGWDNLFCVEDLYVMLRTVPAVSDAYMENDFPAVRTPDFEVVLKNPRGIEEGAWELCGYEGGASVSAADTDGISAGIYDLLERMGFRFEMTGPVIPDMLSDLGVFSEKVVPALRRRGPRLYVNFPMDISSYSLAEAKKYIRNLARLKFNSIDFHSYAGQWTSGSVSNRNIGNYFYGCAHNISKNAVIREKVRNEKVFCIPEAEPYYQDPEKNSRIARWWMRQVTDECVRVGLRVAMSFEPAGYGKQDDAFSIAEEILCEYPGVSELELMTMEMVGSEGYEKGTVDAEFLQAEIVRVLGESALTPECRDAIKDCTVPDKVLGALQYIDFNRQLQKKLAKTHPGLTVRIGIYVPDVPVLRILYPALENGTDRDHEIGYLPNYGSKRSSDAVNSMSRGKPDTKRTAYYTWAEYDGDMFTVQSHCTGVYELLNMLWKNDPQGRPYSARINHWRLSECADDLRFFSECAITPSLTPEQYHRRTAAFYGIAEPDVYCDLKMQLDRACVTTNIVSFCFVDCWFSESEKENSSAYPGALSDFEKGSEFRAALADCLAKLETLYDASDIRAKAMLRFFKNRLEVSLLHVDASLALAQIGVNEPFIPYSWGKLDDMPQDIREKITQCAETAEFYAKKYLIRHAELMPDRGAEGMLVSYYKTMLFYIDHIKQKYSGIPLPESYRNRPLNPPPMPGER